MDLNKKIKWTWFIVKQIPLVICLIIGVCWILIKDYIMEKIK